MTKIIFFGTPGYVLPIVKNLHKYYKIIAVVTQPPKPAGRKKILKYSPVDDWAHKKGIQVLCDPREIPEADLGIAAAYGKIIPQETIKKFKFGILNIHPSLLPKYRGASPIQAAIASGETETGVSIIQMDEKLDHGPIISSFKEHISNDDTAESLTERLFTRSAEFLINLLPSFLEKKITPKPQDHSQATFTKIITKKDSFIPLETLKDAIVKGKEAKKLYNLIRAMHSWPNCWTTINLPGKQKRLKIISADLKENKLVPKKVQLEGKNEVSWQQFLKGYPDLSFSS